MMNIDIEQTLFPTVRNERTEAIKEDLRAYLLEKPSLDSFKLFLQLRLSSELATYKVSRTERRELNARFNQGIDAWMVKLLRILR
jgi:hypothetical protein